MGMAKTIALIKALGGGNGGSGGSSSGDGVLVVNEIDGSLDKTWSEIHSSSVPVFVRLSSDGSVLWSMVTTVVSSDDAYAVETTTSTYVALTENGYPDYDDGGGVK